jgi:methylated-DNA-[protein]-cysteine S-methyltransferase
MVEIILVARLTFSRAAPSTQCNRDHASVTRRMTMATPGTRHAIVSTSIGAITLVASADALTGVYFPGHWYKPNVQAFGTRIAASTDPVLAVAAQQLKEYLAGERVTFDVTTATQGDPFQERVWAALREIPYAETITYGALAKTLGGGALAHEVGQAVGRNPLSIVVACHRVVGKDGKLTGYAGGLERKRRLLELESQHGRTQARPGADRLVQERFPAFITSGQ